MGVAPVGDGATHADLDGLGDGLTLRQAVAREDQVWS